MPDAPSDDSRSDAPRSSGDEGIDILEQAAAETESRENGEASSDHATSDRATSDRATSDRATSDRATSDRATSDGSPTDDASDDPAGEDALPFEASQPTGPDERRITDIRTQSKDDTRVSVFVDGEFAFGCHQDVAAKHGLNTGQRLTPEMQQEIEVDENIVQAKQTAFTYLAHKPRTETEVRRKLRRKDIGRRVIDEVIERLHELDYLDDEQYARDYAHNRFSNKGYGPIRIERELIERGIDRHLAEKTVAAFFEEENEMDAARKQARKRWPRVAGEQDIRKQKRKLFGYLQRRGFTPEVIYQVVDELVDP